jgi:hypothetical protein
MLLNLLESTDQSDCRPYFSAYAEAMYTRGCVTNESFRVYTAHVYAGQSEESGP